MRALTLIAALFVAAAFAGTSLAATPVPFPSDKAGPVFISAHTTTADGAMASWFLPGDKVYFRANAIVKKTGAIVTNKMKKYFYVTIPGQPNVKMAWDSSSPMKNMPWTGVWTVPSNFSGLVSFHIFVKTTSKDKGEFVQMPVGPSQLNIASNAMPVFGPAPTFQAANPSGKVTLGLYVDAVNGTRPTGAAPRLVGCSQTNVFKRGEQFVLRVWGMDLKSGAVLSNDNVASAKYSIAGQPDTTLNWGAHGTDPNKVFFWTGPWNIPLTVPLGTTTVHITYTLVDGTVGTTDFDINIIP